MKSGEIMKGSRLFEKFKRVNKIYYIFFLVLIGGILAVGIPTLARYKSRAVEVSQDVWNGEVATSYKKGSGSKSDPYVISSGGELAYFSNMLKTTDYQNTYFVLSNDILLNDGIFQYDQENGVSYVAQDKKMYVKEYTDLLYDDVVRSSLSSLKVNLLSSLDNFKGKFDGAGHTIYGAYITSSDREEVGLFTNLSGEVSNLFVKNAMVYGGTITGGVASSANSSQLRNILYDGFVVGKSQLEEKSKVIEVSNQTQDGVSDNKSFDIDLSSTLDSFNGVSSSVVLSGVCNSNLTVGNITVNGIIIPECQNSTFEINLGEMASNKLTVDLSLSDATSYQLTDLKYTIHYQEGIAAGVVGRADNLTLENVINKSSVFSKSLSSGLVSLNVGDLEVSQSYNTGNINSSMLASGLVGYINLVDSDVLISKSYHSGSVLASKTAGILGVVNQNSKTVSIVNSFQTSGGYSIDTVNNASVSVENSYQTEGNAVRSGSLNGSFSLDTLSNIISGLSFQNYVSDDDFENNPSHVWVVGKSNLPVLFIDDILNSNVVVTVGNYSWNSLFFDLDNYYYSSKLTFNIEEKDHNGSVLETYYYISDRVLTSDEISSIASWTKFDEITSIKDEGSYVIYVKSVDIHGNVDYLNTDILVLDSTAPMVEMKYDYHSWNSFTTDISNTYIDSSINLRVLAEDSLSKVSNIYYYISDKALSLDEVSLIGDEEWVSYSDFIVVSEKKTSIVYVKVLDYAGNSTIINSDYLVYGGYSQSKMYVGEEEVDTKEVSLTSKSSISFSYQFVNSSPYLKEYTRNLVVNKMLPLNTKVTLIDKVNHKVYTYEVVEERDSSIYPFSLFKEVGVVSNESKYQDVVSTSIQDDYKVLLDFSKTNISEAYQNISLKLQILDSKKNVIYSTLDDGMHSFSLYPNLASELVISSTYQSSVVYNSDSTVVIPVQSTLSMHDENIFDTTSQNKLMGLTIKMVDSKQKVVSKKYLKNLEFMVGEQAYFPDSDGVVRINLNQKAGNLVSSIKIITSKDNIDLDDDVYHFEITSYLADDGVFAKSSSNTLTIPIVYEKDYQSVNYKFRVDGSLENKVLSKKNENTLLNYQVITSGLSNSNVRVSLYRKSVQSAYNNKYSLIDLKDYTNDNLASVSFGSYSVLGQSFGLNLLTSKLTPGGYYLLFELYDGNVKVGENIQRFILK